MTKKVNVESPIFMIGCGRSGTTLTMRLLAGHPELAWLSNFNDRLPNFAPISFLSRFYSLRVLFPIPRPFSKLIPLPSEAYNVWDSCKAVENSPSDPPLSAADLSEQEAECIRQMMGNAVHYMGRTRFLDKNTRNSRRIEYLIAVFPDALFIHMIRDPRAVVSSFLKVDWWPDLQIWSQNNVTPKQWEKEGRDPAELAAGLWCAESEYILDRIDMLKDRYLQVFYEDLVSEPDSEIRRILDFVGLEWQYNFERFFNSVSIRKENNLKFRRYLSKTQIKVVGDMAAPIMNRLGRSYT